LNVAVFQVDPHNPQECILREPIMVDPNKYDNVIYLLLHGTHYQRIITSDGCFFMNEHHPLLRVTKDLLVAQSFILQMTTIQDLLNQILTHSWMMFLITTVHFPLMTSLLPFPKVFSHLKHLMTSIIHCLKI
jgi:hypothetical protein